MKRQNAKMERKQDDINLEVNQIKVRQGCALFFVGFYDAGCDREK